MSDTQGYKGVVPYLFYDDVEMMLDWYKRNFGFRELSRWKDPDGNVQNAEMAVGDTELWLDGGGRRARNANGQPLSLWVGLWVEDVDATHEQLLTAGLPIDPPEDKPYGVRMLTVTDPEGYQWGFMKRISEGASD